MASSSILPVYDDNSITDSDIIVRRLIAINPTNPSCVDIELTSEGRIILNNNGLKYGIDNSGLRYENDGLSSYSLLKYPGNDLLKLRDDVIDFTPRNKLSLPPSLHPTYVAVSWHVGTIREETNRLAQFRWSVDKGDENQKRGQSHLLLGMQTGITNKDEKRKWYEIRNHLKHSYDFKL